VTGWDVTVDELVKLGERRINLMRVFNAREGINRNADQLPKKFYKALQGEGPTAGIALTHEEIESALDEYYRLGEMTPNGEPTRVKLEKLDLAWAAELL
jgi:aldehyde:ferredoxin oxidoreductase